MLLVSYLKTARMPSFYRQLRSCSYRPLTYGKTAVAIRDKNRRQVLFLLGDNRGFCYETFGTLVESLDTMICVRRIPVCARGEAALLFSWNCGVKESEFFKVVLPPWWGEWNAAGCSDAVRSSQRFRDPGWWMCRQRSYRFQILDL